jgi:hypothetical protein
MNHQLLMYIFGALILIMNSWLPAQTHKPLQRKQDISKEPLHIIITPNFNNISGVGLEFNLTNKQNAATKSSVSLLGGYSSRLAKFYTDTSSGGQNKWIHGIGFAGSLNNYSTIKLERFYWSLGVGGHIFFYRQQKLKTFSVFGHVGYKKILIHSLFADFHLGLGLMGSTFISSTDSDINGYFIHGGISLGYIYKR